MGHTSLESNFRSVAGLAQAFQDAGCEKVLVKVLARNQDNEKNQVYLGMDDMLLSVFPGKILYSAKSESTKKRNSHPGVGKVTLSLTFSWLWADGSESSAPHAKIIYYFQYPEIRLSGFLRGCARSPRAMRREEQDEFGRRVLLLGIRDDEVLGVLATDQDGLRLIDELEGLPVLPGQQTMRIFPIPKSVKSTNLPKLLMELRELAGVWQPAQKFGKNDLTPVPRKSQQGSGWTLEALLGIKMNSIAGPDKYGYEIKVLPPKSALSVITSEPDFGYRKEHPLIDFLWNYGWPGTKGDGSYRFNGEHNTVRPYSRSKAIIVLDHWDMENNAPDGSGTPAVRLVYQPSGQVLAGWSYDKLAEKWSHKHDGCVYVEYHRRPLNGGFATDYMYGSRVYCGLGTSINHLFRALRDGIVYLDPGDRVLENGDTKNRMQWRVKNTKALPLVDRLPQLYVDWQEYQIS